MTALPRVVRLLRGQSESPSRTVHVRRQRDRSAPICEPLRRNSSPFGPERILQKDVAYNKSVMTSRVLCALLGRRIGELCCRHDHAQHATGLRVTKLLCLARKEARIAQTISNSRASQSVVLREALGCMRCGVSRPRVPARICATRRRAFDLRRQRSGPCGAHCTTVTAAWHSPTQWHSLAMARCARRAALSADGHSPTHWFALAAAWRHTKKEKLHRAGLSSSSCPALIVRCDPAQL